MSFSTNDVVSPSCSVLERWLSTSLCFTDFDGNPQLFAPDHIHHDGNRSSEGQVGFSQLLKLYAHCHEDVLVDFQTVIEAGPLVTVFMVASGRMIGPLPGQIPSGRKISRPMVWTFHRENEVVVRSWSRCSQVAPLREAEVTRPTKLPPCSQPESLVGTEKLSPLSGQPERCLWARKWKLGPRLAQTAVLLMNGYERREVAETLGLKPSTVQSYIKELFAKSGVHGRIELARAASLVDYTHFS